MLAEHYMIFTIYIIVYLKVQLNELLKDFKEFVDHTDNFLLLVC